MSEPRPARPEWATEAYPELREHPPWLMSEMVVAQRGLPGPILAHPSAALVAAAVDDAVAAGDGVLVTGCGTSEHAALAIAALICDALGKPGAAVSSQAFDSAAAPRRGLCIAVSHNGSSSATVAALQAARRDGARTCLITAAGSSEAHHAADLVYPTPLEDASWCHTVGYSSPILAGAAIASSLAGQPLQAQAISERLAACDRALEAIAASVEPFSGMARLLSVGSGLDAITAAEQALKIEEGAWIPTTNLHLETLLHGHLPAADGQTGLFAFLLDPTAGAERVARTRQALQAARAVGAVTLLVTSAEYLGELGDESEANRVVLPAADSIGLLGALLGGAVALQRITLALSLQRGTNPDLLRRDDARYRNAALLGAHKLKPFAPAP